MKDDQFWANLGKVFRYVQKGSGRIVFHMPRKSKSWQHSFVKQALEAHGLNKVTFSLNGELTSVATNDYCVLDYLSPHLSGRERDEPVAVRGIYDAWCSSCRQAEAPWLKLATSTPGLEDSPNAGVDGGYLSGGADSWKPMSSYRLLPCSAAVADDELRERFLGTYDAEEDPFVSSTTRMSAVEN